MKAIKGLLIYIGIVLAFIVGIGLILLCAMYFIPSFKLFGVGLVHYAKNSPQEVIVLDDYTGYSDIELSVNSKNIDINIVPTDGENISYKLKQNVFGFSTEIVEYKINKQVEVVDGKLQIFLNVSEPNGWIATRDSIAIVNIPNAEYFKLIANSNVGDISIGNKNHNIKLTDLSVTTGSGNLLLTNIGTGENSRDLTLDTMNLSTTTGMFNLTCIDNLTVNNVVKLSATNGDFRFNNINASLDVTGVGIKLSAKEVICGANGFKFIAQNGYFDFDKLSSPVGAENTIVTENASVAIDEISGKSGIITTYGNVNIGTLKDYTLIENENGKVTIAEALSDIVVKTHFGDINVAAYAKSGTFKSEKGNMDLKSTSDYVAGYFTEIENKDGNINLENKANKLYLKTTGYSNVYLKFLTIAPSASVEHVVSVDKDMGKADIQMPINAGAFKFQATGNVSGEMGDNVEAKNEWQYFPNNSDENVELAENAASFRFTGNIIFHGWY